ncbi:MAG: peptide ABC transporter substrate-binding protein [Tissierellia bacterium]|nr:peptide ABC transporter substrate-binding protein [Tissierellia bacterium]
MSNLKRCSLVSISIGILVLLLCGCAKKESIEDRYETVKLTEYVDKTPTSGGEVLIPLSVLDTLNPLLTKNESYYYFSKLIYESVVEKNDKGETVNKLAETIHVIEDGKRINVTLKPDVFWHDGAPLKSEDVAMTLEAIKGLDEDSPYRQIIKSIVGKPYDYDIYSLFKIEVYDSRNFDITFDKGYVDAIDILTIPVLPSHLLDEGKIFAKENFNPIGTGPYQLYQFKSGRELILKSNDKYVGGAPLIKMVRGKIFTDSSRALTAFDTGQVHMSLSPGTDWEKYKGNSRVKTSEFLTNEVEMLAMNIQSPKFSSESGKSLRQAISLSINRKVIIDRVYLGNAVEPTWLLSPSSSLAKLVENAPSFDLEKAKSILNEAGLVDTNGDGIREWKDGNPIKISILTNLTNRDRNLIARYVSEDLRKIGVDPQIVGNPDNVITGSVDLKQNDFSMVMGRISRGEYDIAIYGMQLSPVTDLSKLLSSASINGSDNVARYSNEDVDYLVRRTKQAIEEVQLDNAEEEIESESKPEENFGTDQMLYGQTESASEENEVSSEKSNNGKVRDLSRSVNELVNITKEDPAYIVLAYKKRALLVDYIIMGDVNSTVQNIYNNFKSLYIPVGFQ